MAILGHPVVTRARSKGAFLGHAVLLIGSLLAVPAAPAQSDAPTEHQVKAAFLYNFAKFVEWPVEAFTGPSAPFQLCVLGEDPFGSDLRDLVKGKVVGGRAVQVLNPRNLMQSRTCHILFVSPSEQAHMEQIIKELRDQSVLIVGDKRGFAEQGGMVNFVMENDRVRFEINVKAAERAGLKISSKLLNLAKFLIV